MPNPRTYSISVALPARSFNGITYLVDSAKAVSEERPHESLEWAPFPYGARVICQQSGRIGCVVWCGLVVKEMAASWSYGYTGVNTDMMADVDWEWPEFEREYGVPCERLKLVEGLDAAPQLQARTAPTD